MIGLAVEVILRGLDIVLGMVSANNQVKKAYYQFVDVMVSQKVISARLSLKYKEQLERLKELDKKES